MVRMPFTEANFVPWTLHRAAVTMNESDNKAHQPATVPIARRITRRIPRFWWAKGGSPRMPMVGWFDPGQLAATGIRSVVSFFIGEQSDKRLVQALAARRQEPYDHTVHYSDRQEGPVPRKDAPRDELWIDYVCDTGDGWDPTYAVAYAVSQPSLGVGGTGLPRGDVLVFGGDEVYPTPTRAEYQRRLVAPYMAAFGQQRPEERPHVYAIPGNHDWYDGLSAFSRLFCSDTGRRFAGQWTRQHRSYFALKLPHRWWLVGVDSALQSDLDVPQLEYFRHIAEHAMEPGDKVVLCLSQPVWVYAHKYRRMGRAYDETDLLYLREGIFAKRGVEVRVFLSGDLHHYRRHEELLPPGEGRQPVQKITAGGGGAFLHPTHEDDFSFLEEEPPRAVGGEAKRYAMKAVYPAMDRSARLAWGNLLFLFKNPRFGIAPALLYLFTVWLVGASIGVMRPTDPARALRYTSEAFAEEPGLAVWMITIVALFWAFTDTHSRVYRILAGSVHVSAHFAAMFYVGWGVLQVASELFPDPWIVPRTIATGTGIFMGGWIVGSVLMGLYLLISVNVFGRHNEEAFSSLRVKDFKHFLRLHIGRDGALTIHPIKVERVPRKWRGRREEDASPSAVQPVDPLKAEYIERPVVVR